MAGLTQNTVTTPTTPVHREKPRDGRELVMSRQLPLRVIRATSRVLISIDGFCDTRVGVDSDLNQRSRGNERNRYGDSGNTDGGQKGDQAK
jgi:hypothetical protein